VADRITQFRMIPEIIWKAWARLEMEGGKNGLTSNRPMKFGRITRKDKQ
jgi:hypothetical protein